MIKLHTGFQRFVIIPGAEVRLKFLILGTVHQAD